MIYITVELNQDIYIKIPKVKEGISPYNLTMTSQAGGQQMVFADLVDNSDKSSVYRFTLNFTQYTPSGIYNYVLVDSADKVMSKGLIQVNMNNTDDYFYADDGLGYFVEEEESGDMNNYYTKSQVDSMLTQYEKKSDLPDFNNFVTEEELGEYVTSEELQQEVESYINSKDLINSTQLTNTLEWYVTLNELQSMGYVTASELPTVNDATVTIKQGGDVMGSFTLNQSNNVEILLNEGGQGGGISMNDVKQYVVSQSYVTSDYLTSQSYVINSDLTNYATKSYVQKKINEIPGVDLSAYVKYSDLNNYGYVNAQDIVNQSYVTSSTLNDYATKSYVQEKINEIPGQDLSAYVKYSDLNNYGYITAQDIVNQSYAKLSDISNAGVMIKQGGVLKGSFNLNQSTGVEINLDAGGSGGGVTMEEVKQYVVSQSYVTSSTLNDYATKSYVQSKVNDMDLSSYVKYSDLNNYGYITAQDIVNQSYVTNSDLTNYATKAYVQEKINEIPGADLSAYVTKTDLVNQSYVTNSDLTNYATKSYVQDKVNDIDLSSYVKYSDLNNYGYQTSTQVQNTVNTSINNLNTVTLVFTLSDNTTRTIISYVQ